MVGAKGHSARESQRKAEEERRRIENERLRAEEEVLSPSFSSSPSCCLASLLYAIAAVCPMFSWASCVSCTRDAWAFSVCAPSACFAPVTRCVRQRLKKEAEILRLAQERERQILEAQRTLERREKELKKLDLSKEEVFSPLTRDRGVKHQASNG